MTHVLRADARVIVAKFYGEEIVLLEIASEGEVWVYSADDWRRMGAPSFGWDGAVLRKHDGTCFWGRTIEVVPLPSVEAEALLLAQWSDVDGVFVYAPEGGQRVTEVESVDVPPCFTCDPLNRNVGQRCAAHREAERVAESLTRA